MDKFYSHTNSNNMEDSGDGIQIITLEQINNKNNVDRLFLFGSLKSYYAPIENYYEMLGIVFLNTVEQQRSGEDG